MAFIKIITKQHSTHASQSVLIFNILAPINYDKILSTLQIVTTMMMLIIMKDQEEGKKLDIDEQRGSGIEICKARYSM